MKFFLIILLFFSHVSLSKEFVCHKADDASQARFLYGFIESEKELIDVVWQIGIKKIKYLGDLFATTDTPSKEPDSKSETLHSYFVRDFKTSKVELWFEKDRMINDDETSFSASIGSSNSKISLLCEKKD